MQYSLLPHEISFKKLQNANQSPLLSSRLLLIIPLTQRQAVLIYDDFTLCHIELASMKSVHVIKLPGRAYDGVAINSQKLILMMVQKKNIIEVDFSKEKIKQIYKISTSLVYNSNRQATNFFLSKLRVFNDSQSYYLQQDLAEDRKVKIVYFPSQKASTQKEPTQKEPTLSAQPFQLVQFESKRYTTHKLDQKSKVVKFLQNPEQNRLFRFEQIDLQTNEKTQIQVQNQSFVLFSTIIDIKKINQDKYIICLNSKDSQHEIIIYNRNEKSEKFFTSKKLIKQCIGINFKLNIGIFSFLYGTTSQFSQIIMMIDLESGIVVDEMQIEADKLKLSKDQMYFLQYSTEKKPSKQSKFKTYNLVHKRTKYLKMLQNLKVQAQFGHQFCGLVVQMFE